MHVLKTQTTNWKINKHTAYTKSYVQIVLEATLVKQSNIYLKHNGHKYSKSDKTALYYHKIHTDHTFDYDNAIILDKELHHKKREFKEMIDDDEEEMTSRI